MPAMKSAFKTVALIGNYNNPEIREQILTLANFMVERQLNICIEEKTAQHLNIRDYSTVEMDAIGTKADLAVVLGGDGTMLSVARALVDYSIPLIGVNRGRFGFLTDVSSASMLETMSSILAGQFDTEQRIL